MKNILKIILVALLVLVGKTLYAQPFTGEAFIENPQVNGLVFSWELHFERTNNWTPGFITNVLGKSTASFNFNTLGLTNPSLVVEPGSPLDNTNYNLTVQIINDKCIVDIPWALNELAGTLILNVKTKLFTVSVDITNTSLTAGLSWDADNTGFFDNADATVITTLTGGSNLPLPVELSAFTAKFKDNSEVDLNWVTKTEVSNYGFNVERRINEGEWNTLEFVKGYGNSNSPKQYSYTDKDLFEGGSKFQYRLKQVDTDGKYEYSDVVEVEIMPTKFELSQNYPNPFNPSTTVRFSLPKQTQLKINIYNMLGEMVQTLAEGTYDAGYHKVTFSASALPSGAYIYRIESADFVQVRKMILIK